MLHKVLSSPIQMAVWELRLGFKVHLSIRIRLGLGIWLVWLKLGDTKHIMSLTAYYVTPQKDTYANLSNAFVCIVSVWE